MYLFLYLVYNNNNNNNNNKEAKYATLQGTHLFQPVVVESMGTVEEATSSFLTELGHRISALSGDNRETSFLFQRIFVVVQRFNSVLLRESFSVDSRPEDDHWSFRF